MHLDQVALALFHDGDQPIVLMCLPKGIFLSTTFL